MANEKRLIDANELQRRLDKLSAEPDYQHPGEDWGVGVSMADTIVWEMPTIDAVEVVRGRWIDVRGIPSVNRKDVPVVKCSKCKIYFCDLINNHHYMYHYCPNCGAKMDGDGNG